MKKVIAPLVILASLSLFSCGHFKKAPVMDAAACNLPLTPDGTIIEVDKHGRIVDSRYSTVVLDRAGKNTVYWTLEPEGDIDIRTLEIRPKRDDARVTKTDTGRTVAIRGNNANDPTCRQVPYSVYIDGHYRHDPIIIIRP